MTYTHNIHYTFKMNNENNNIRIRDKGKLLYLSNSITKKALLLKALLLNRNLRCLFLLSTEWRFFFENFLAFFPSFSNQWKYLLCTNTQIHIYTMITIIYTYIYNNGFEEYLWVCDWVLWIWWVEDRAVALFFYTRLIP